MGVIPRGDVAQSLAEGAGWGQVPVSLPVVLGLSLWRLCLGILSKRGQSVHEEGAPGAGWGGYLLQLHSGELHVRALGDLVLIPGRWGGREGGGRERRRERGAAQLDVVGLGEGLFNPPWVGLRASVVPFGALCQLGKRGPFLQVDAAPLLHDTLVLALGKQASRSPGSLLPDDQPFLSQWHLPLSWLCFTFTSSRKPLLIVQPFHSDVLFPHLFPISSPESLSFKQAVPLVESALSILLTRYPLLTLPAPAAPPLSPLLC